MKEKRGYTTSFSLAVFSPFALMPPPEEMGGILLGEDEYRRPVYLNYNRLPNFHGIILGPTGSGKSTTVENLLYDLHNNGMNFMVIDPGLDYVDTVEKLGGFIIDMSENIPDIYEAPCDMDYWLSMMANAFGYALDLDPYSIGAIRTALDEAGSVENIADRLMGHPDLLGRLRNVLNYISNPNLNVREIVERNVPSCLVYRSREKRLPPEVEKFLTIYFIMWTREYFMSQRPIHRPRYIVIIDEAWRLLKGTEKFNLVDYIRETRKYGLDYWIITQSVTDMPVEAYEQFGYTLALSGPRIHAMKLDALAKLRKQDIDWMMSHRRAGYGILLRLGFPKPTPLRIIVREEILRRRGAR